MVNWVVLRAVGLAYPVYVYLVYLVDLVCFVCLVYLVSFSHRTEWTKQTKETKWTRWTGVVGRCLRDEIGLNLLPRHPSTPIPVAPFLLEGLLRACYSFW